MYNKSKTYLLPLLSEVINFDMKFINNLLNTYMFEESNEYPECLCIVHDFSFKVPEFTAYEHRLTASPLFVKSIDIDNKVIYIFKFPDEYIQEYYSLAESKYSEFGNDAKELILRFWADIYSNNPNGIPFLIKVKQILYRDEKLKQILEKNLKITLTENQELGDYVEKDNETLKVSDYQKSK